MLSRIICIFMVIFLFGCSTPKVKVEVSNLIDIPRENETIEVSWDKIKNIIPEITENQIAIYESDKKTLPIQLLDEDLDGTIDKLLFKSSFDSNQIKTFYICSSDTDRPKILNRSFARISPEHYNDLAWENDKIAFRAYGPYFKTSENHDSGIDCWLKRVDYPILEKWYKGSLNGISYHEDHGEGHDPYHAGTTRGCGGLAIWHNDRMYLSNVYTKANVISDGPIRSIIELEYEWEIESKIIKELRKMTIDSGKRFFKVDTVITEDNQPCTYDIAIGVTTHQGNGEGSYNQDLGWISCWEEIEGSNLGTGVVINPTGIKKIIQDLSVSKDMGHVIIITSCDLEGQLSYYAGYGWDKAGEIKTNKQWESELSNFSKQIVSPLKVKLK